MIIFEGDAEKFAALLPNETQIVASYHAGTSKHLILNCRGMHLRACVTDAPKRIRSRLVVPTGALAPIRLAAAQQLYALRAGHGRAFTRPPFSPTPYHRRHLARLLAIADAAKAGATARDIAFEIVFPNSRLDSARDWKGSSEQRQTRRLTREAERMVEGGFWKFPCFAPD